MVDVEVLVARVRRAATSKVDVEEMHRREDEATLRLSEVDVEEPRLKSGA